jgi:two-component system CheB/CheR fusion protein
MFHYALKPGGFLLLGLSEAIGTDTDLFAPIDRKHKLYAKKPARRADFGVRADKLTSQTTPSAVNTERTREVPGFDPYKEADRILVTKYTPASVLVNGRMEIMQVRGSANAYLEAPTGKATHNVLKMAR